MEDLTNPQITRNKYLNLPKPIKEWLASETISYLIGEINDRLGLDEENEEKYTLIPNLILRLAIQDLDPTDFIGEISDGLGVNWQTAKAIAGDVEKKVLRPIENDLRKELGIDLKLIYFGKPKPQAAIPLEASPALARPEGPRSGLPLTGPPVSHPTEWEKLRGVPPTPQTKLAMEPKPIAEQKPIAPKIEVPKTKFIKREEEMPIEPFLLHQENYSAANETAAKEPPKNQPNLEIKVRNYFDSTGIIKEKKAPKPVSATIEMPKNKDEENLARPAEMKAKAQNLMANIEEQKMRVVHYNEMRTPLTSLGTPKTPPMENRVDLRKFAKPDLNTVDLRKNK